MKIFTSCNVQDFLAHAKDFADNIIQTQNTCDIMVFPSLEHDMREQLEKFANEIATPEWEKIKQTGAVGIFTLDPKIFIDLYNHLETSSYDVFEDTVRYMMLPRIILQGPMITTDIEDKVPNFFGNTFDDIDVAYWKDNNRLYIKNSQEFIKHLIGSFMVHDIDENTHINAIEGAILACASTHVIEQY